MCPGAPGAAADPRSPEWRPGLRPPPAAPSSPAGPAPAACAGRLSLPEPRKSQPMRARHNFLLRDARSLWLNSRGTDRDAVAAAVIDERVGRISANSWLWGGMAYRANDGAVLNRAWANDWTARAAAPSL